MQDKIFLISMMSAAQMLFTCFKSNMTEHQTFNNLK